MFWIIFVVAAALGLLKLGALSVWVVVLSWLLKIVLVLLIAAVLYLIWQRFFGRQP